VPLPGVNYTSEIHIEPDSCVALAAVISSKSQKHSLSSLSSRRMSTIAENFEKPNTRSGKAGRNIVTIENRECYV